MALYTDSAVQAVLPQRSVLYTDAPVTSQGVMHRAGTGTVTLRGACDQCFARYRVSFGANLAISAGGTAGAVTLALAVDGEVLPSTAMTVTPATVGEFFNVSRLTEIAVPRGCCQNVSAVNISTQSVDVQAVSLAINRVA